MRSISTLEVVNPIIDKWQYLLMYVYKLKSAYVCIKVQSYAVFCYYYFESSLSSQVSEYYIVLYICETSNEESYIGPKSPAVLLNVPNIKLLWLAFQS